MACSVFLCMNRLAPALSLARRGGRLAGRHHLAGGRLAGRLYDQGLTHSDK